MLTADQVGALDALIAQPNGSVFADGGTTYGLRRPTNHSLAINFSTGGVAIEIAYIGATGSVSVDGMLYVSNLADWSEIPHDRLRGLVVAADASARRYADAFIRQRDARVAAYEAESSERLKRSLDRL